MASGVENVARCGPSPRKSYTYEPNPNGQRYFFRQRKDGTWEEVVFSHETSRYRATGCFGLRIGERQEYRDFSF